MRARRYVRNQVYRRRSYRPRGRAPNLFGRHALSAASRYYRARAARSSTRSYRLQQRLNTQIRSRPTIVAIKRKGQLAALNKALLKEKVSADLIKYISKFVN